MLTKSEATERLVNRWNEQTERFPLMRNEITLALYIARNIKIARENDQLANYARA